jgi:hypothetical protein
MIGDAGVESVKLPLQSPNLNAYAERLVRSIKEYCLERLIFFGEASLRTAGIALLVYRHRRYSRVIRPLRYSINVTLDRCCDHRVIPPDKDLYRHAVENLDQADALLFGRVTYEMMEAAWRSSVRTGARPDWMETFRPDDRRGKEVRRVEHLGLGRLERGARARGSRDGRSAAQARVG